MKKQWIYIFILITFIFSGLARQYLYGQEVAANEVILYEYINYTGESASIKLHPDLPYWSTGVGNKLWNKVSSIRIGSDVGVYLFKNPNFFLRRTSGYFSRKYLIKMFVSTKKMLRDNYYNGIIIYRKSMAGLAGVALSGMTRADFPKTDSTTNIRFMFVYPGHSNTVSYEIGSDTMWRILEFIVPKGEDHKVIATVFHGPKCTGKSVVFESDKNYGQEYLILYEYGFSRDKKNQPKSIRITYTGPMGKPKAPPPPKPDTKEIIPPKDKGTSIPQSKDHSKALPQIGIDAITGCRLFKKSPGQLIYAVEYFIEKRHGTTIYLGGWLYDSNGKAFGGYRPTAVGSPGAGSAKLTFTFDDPSKQVKEIEFFLHEPGKSPFIKRRFRF
jgi:hypothetical protein